MAQNDKGEGYGFFALFRMSIAEYTGVTAIAWK